MLENSSILLTGGTGSFGHSFVPLTLKKFNPKRLIILSRDEMKQWEMNKLFSDDPRVRFFVGDVRDKDRLYRAVKGVESYSNMNLKCTKPPHSRSIENIESLARH